MRYETVIGLEIHSELSTESKLYCGCSTAFGFDENTQCCPVCIGMPGVLPVINKKAIDYCIKAGLALNCEITPFGKQDRKNYFYPDLPKAYQISQFDLPVCVGGYVDIEVNGEAKRIGITRIHLEEDAGKLVHDRGGTRIDYNRCGVPLIEIVTEPDFRSSDEVKVFLETVRNILVTIGVTDGKMEEGSLRCDVNLSLRPEGQEEFGVRSEMKNVNSFRGAVRAIEYERKRQAILLDRGGVVEQETRRWDDVKGVSYALRSKEDAHDYRYFPDPDLVAIQIDETWIQAMNSEIPELPLARRDRYKEVFGLSHYDASLLVASNEMSAYFECCVSEGTNPKLVSNWILGETLRILREKDLDFKTIPFPAQYLSQLIRLIEENVISGTTAKTVFEKMFEDGKKPEDIVKENNLGQVSDVDEIRSIVAQIIEKNPKSVQDFREGKEKAIGFLVGQTMAATKGQGNPQVINEILRELLGAS